MARQKTPALVKAKDVILALCDEDIAEVKEWLDRRCEVLTEEKERKERQKEYVPLLPENKA